MWSVGVIAYALLCGRLPFDADTTEGTRKRIVAAKLRFPPQWWKRLPEAQEFIKALLMNEPADRLTAEAALDHPWIRGIIAQVPQTPAMQTTETYGIVARRLTSFKRFGPLKRISLLCIALHLNREDMRSLRRLFSKLDTNNTGSISFDELCRVLGDMPEWESKQLFTELDQTCSGSITYTEFLAAAMERSIFLNEQKMNEAFDLLDQDGDGFLTRVDLVNLLGAFKDNDMVNEMINEADFDSDGKIHRDDWIHLMLGTTPDFGDPTELRSMFGVDLQFDSKS